MAVSKDQTQQKKLPLFYVALCKETKAQSPKGDDVVHYQTIAFSSVFDDDQRSIEELGRFALEGVNKREMYEYITQKFVSGEWCINIIPNDKNPNAQETLNDALGV